MHIIPLSLLSCYNDGKGGDDLRVIFKALIVVVIILAFPLSIVLVFKNWSTAIGTSTPMQLKFDWLDQYEPIYLFWSGIILAAVLIVLLIITLFGHGHSYYIFIKSLMVKLPSVRKLLSILLFQHFNMNPLLVTPRYQLSYHEKGSHLKYRVIY